MRSASRYRAVVVAMAVLVAVAACSNEPPERSAGERAIAPTNWAAVDERLDALAPSATLLAAEVGDDGTLMPIQARTPDDVTAIGSAFRVYVLGILTDRIAGGVLKWDDALTITAADKSTPPGELQDRPHGSTVSVREAALLMMAGDNTATDLLVSTVGREEVEYIVPTMGMTEESQDRTFPLLTTRERTILWGLDDADRRAYVDAGHNKRRYLLLELADELPPATSEDQTRPVDLDVIGWFASPTELVRAQLWIDSQRGLPGQEPLDEIMTAGRGDRTPDSSTWPRFSVTAGQQPGVYTVSWLLQRADGRRFVVAIVANDASGPVDAGEGAAIVAGAIDLLAAA